MLKIERDSKLSQSRRQTRQVVIPLVISLMALGSLYVLHSLAQSSDGLWTTPVNISQSGAASQPAIAVAPDSTFHVMWWDTINGEQYARTTNLTGTVWSKPVAVPQIFGQRTIITNSQTGKVTITLIPPREVRMLSDAEGNVHTFWYDVDNQLLNTQIKGAGWSNATVLADTALNMDVAADVSGTLHLAYVRPLDTANSPSGVYYRATIAGSDWSAPELVYASSYFRSVKPEEVQVSVAGDGQGRALVTWTDPRLDQSLYARSTDGGRTWTAPQAIESSQTNRAIQARAAATPQGQFLLIWQDASLGICGLSQIRSEDGGQTWSTPERVLTGLARCPERWSFVPGGDPSSPTGIRLWLLGMPRQASQATTSTGVLVTWDGKTWSESGSVSPSFRDTTVGKVVNLGCLNMALAGTNLGVVGCDTSGDIWTVHNTMELDRLSPALKPVWDALETLSDRHSNAGLPALAADKQGTLYTLWSQSVGSEPGTALYAAVWENNRWSSAAKVLHSPDVSTGIIGSNQSTSKDEQPSLAVDSQGRLHAVWSGGLNGQVFYSWAYSRDATSVQGWSAPVALPAPTLVGSWPDIVVDPRGDVLHVVYAVPYNEGRGIYYVRSNDGGATWQPPSVVFSAVAAGWDSADKPRLALDARSNMLHAVWLRSQPPGGVGTQAVFYARSTDGGQTWSVPTKIAEGIVDWPQVAVADAGQVHLVWNQAQTQSGDNNVFTSEVWNQFSPDDGERWTTPARVRGFETVSGPVGLVSEGTSEFHLVGVGRGPSDESMLLYTRWDGRAWGEQQTFGLGQNAAPGNAAVASLVPGARRLRVVVHEFVMEQIGVGRFEAIATGREVALASTPEPLPTFTPLPTQTFVPTTTPRPTATAKPQLISTTVPRTAEKSPLQGTTPLIIGGSLAAVIVLIVGLARTFRGMRY